MLTAVVCFRHERRQEELDSRCGSVDGRVQEVLLRTLQQRPRARHLLQSRPSTYMYNLLFYFFIFSAAGRLRRCYWSQRAARATALQVFQVVHRQHLPQPVRAGRRHRFWRG